MSMWMLPQDLATPEAFSRDPSRVWEFFHYRREVALSKKPNAAHLAIAECEARLKKQGRSVVVITQCIDDLLQKAGTKHVLKIHGEGQSCARSTRCYESGNLRTINNQINKFNPKNLELFRLLSGNQIPKVFY